MRQRGQGMGVGMGTGTDTRDGRRGVALISATRSCAAPCTIIAGGRVRTVRALGRVYACMRKDRAVRDIIQGGNAGVQQSSTSVQSPASPPDVRSCRQEPVCLHAHLVLRELLRVSSAACSDPRSPELALNWEMPSRMKPMSAAVWNMIHSSAHTTGRQPLASKAGGRDGPCAGIAGKRSENCVASESFALRKNRSSATSQTT
jgi:hypothetical protein